MLWQLSPTCVLWCLEMQLCFHDACWKHLWVPLFCLLGLGAPHLSNGFKNGDVLKTHRCDVTFNSTFPQQKPSRPSIVPTSTPRWWCPPMAGAPHRD